MGLIPTPDFSFVGEALDSLYDSDHPADSLALLPLVGGPFAYHTFRSGRGTWISTGVSAAIGVGFTHLTFQIAGRSAGFTATELMLGRGLGALGFTYGGRFFGFSALARAPISTAGMGWRVPHWATTLAMYEYQKWFFGKVTTAHTTEKTGESTFGW